MRLPDGDGLDLVEWIQSHRPGVPVAVITAHGNVEAAVRALKLGAFDFISKPLDLGGAAQADHGDAEARRGIDRGNRSPNDAQAAGRFEAHAAAAADDRQGGALAGAGAYLRRLRHRQGAGRAADPRVGAARGWTVRPRQLWRDPDGTDGERAVRTQEGQLHRRRGRQGRAHSQRRGRHAVPRRSRRSAAAHAGQAAARDPGEGDSAGGRDCAKCRWTCESCRRRTGISRSW